MEQKNLNTSKSIDWKSLLNNAASTYFSSFEEKTFKSLLDLYYKANTEGENEIALGLISKHIENKKTALAQKSNPNHLISLLLLQGDLSAGNNNFHLAIQFYQKGIDYIESNKTTEFQFLWEFYNNIGVCHHINGNHTAAITFHSKAVSVATNQLKDNRPLAESQQALASNYYQVGFYDSALHLHLESLKHQLKTYGPNSAQVAFCYNEIGCCWAAKGDVIEELNYHQQALEIYLNQENVSLIDIANQYHNIGFCMGSLKNYHEQLQHFKAAQKKWLQIYHPEHPLLAVSHHATGFALANLKRYDEALLAHQRGLTILNSNPKISNSKKSRSYLHLANFYIKCGNPSLAIPLVKKGLELLYSENIPNKNDSLRLRSALANAYLELGQFELAAENAAKSIQQILPNFDSSGEIDIKKLDKSSFSQVLIQPIAQFAKACYKYYQQNEDHIEYLYKAVNTFDFAITGIENLKKSYKKDQSGFILKSRNKVLFQGAVFASLDIFNLTGETKYLKKAFKFAEKSNQLGLSRILLAAETELKAKVSPKLIQQEKEILWKLAEIKTKKVQQALNSDLDLKKELSSQHEEVLLEQTEWVEAIKTKHPSYYNFKFKETNLSLPKLQKQLKAHPKTIVLSYFMNEDKISIFQTTETTFTVTLLPRPPHLNLLIEEFLNAINYLQRKRFIVLAHRLYKLLLKPVLPADYKAQFDSLIIIPSNELKGLPFECLLANSEKAETPYQNLNYLINEIAISYHNSYFHLYHRLKVKALSKFNINEQSSFMGFSPSFRDEKEIRKNANSEINLKYAFEETENIASLFREKGLEHKTFLGEKATINNLKANCKKATFFHIATHRVQHSYRNDQSGLLLFKPEQSDSANNSSESYELLTGPDSYNLELNCLLAIISSCGQANFEVPKMHGWRALNHGFLFSGAQNIIFTIFNVYDKSSSVLIEKLYQKILEGKSISASLREAKKELIVSEETTPKHWSGYVLIGI